MSALLHNDTELSWRVSTPQSADWSISNLISLQGSGSLLLIGRDMASLADGKRRSSGSALIKYSDCDGKYEQK